MSRVVEGMRQLGRAGKGLRFEGNPARSVVPGLGPVVPVSASSVLVSLQMLALQASLHGAGSTGWSQPVVPVTRRCFFLPMPRVGEVASVEGR